MTQMRNSPTQIQKIYAYARGQSDNGGITAPEVADHLGRPMRIISAAMHNMARDGYLAIVGAQKSHGGRVSIFVRADELDRWAE